MKTFLLDSNVVIYLWESNPEILNYLHKNIDYDFKVDNNIILELMKGEPNQCFPEMSEKYILLLSHIINNDWYKSISSKKENRLIVSGDNKTSIVIGNKIDQPDYGLIVICQNNSDFILVTNDKKVLNNAKRVLFKKNFMTFKDFIEEIKNKMREEKGVR